MRWPWGPSPGGPIPEEITFSYATRDGTRVTRAARLSGVDDEGLRRYVGAVDAADFVPDSLRVPVLPGRSALEINVFLGGDPGE